MKICLTTDLHMNRWPNFLNRRLLSKAKNCDALLVLGDITTGHHTEDHLATLGRYSKDVYFVLGNHDFYTSSFHEMEIRVNGFIRDTNLHWLDSSDPVELAPGVWLVGVDGWYDGVHGDLFFMDVNFDRMMIKDLLIKSSPQERVQVIVERAKASAELFSKKMKKVPLDARNVIVATHYPPWMGPINTILDAFWLPQSINSVLSKKIAEEAKKRQSSTRFDVFCGHIHRSYSLQPEENVFCTVLDARSTMVIDV